ncbi:hypothetical protein EI94DRAFT_1772506 [Lactarius quietus]|nr:hypothetical protein EI94DRAFT_1772506 [Lactarius quietus]
MNLASRLVCPGVNFPYPAATTTHQLALRCHPAIKPFLPDDLVDNSSSLIIVDALLRDQEIAGSQSLIMPVSSSSSPEPELFVNVWIDGMPLASGTVPLNRSATIPFSLSKISPRSEPYSLVCTATLSSPEQNFMSIPTSLTYLPSPPHHIGSITKLDLRTGGLLAKRAGTQDPYESVFPVGFYTPFGGYLERNNSVMELEVHPIPPYDNVTAFHLMADEMEKLGLWLIYDMSWSALSLPVMSIRNRSNLLVYYTADEPDGHQDRPWLINSLDPYRPSSLCFNCQDYLFSDYAYGTPILMPDVYPIGINSNYSVIYDTPCTTKQGCCGCDNCHRTLRFWLRTPSYTEFLVEIIIPVNAGASQFARALPELTPFLLSSPLSSPPVYYEHVITTNRMDLGLWVSSDGKALVMAVNLNYFPTTIDLDEVLSATKFQDLALENPRLVVDGGAKIEGTQIKFYRAVLSGTWVFG